MADISNRPPGNLELSGEYLSAMETISAHLMSRLPENQELWRILHQAETLLLEAQMTGTPVAKLFGKGGIAGFCQSIIDERLGKGITPTPPDTKKKSPPRKTHNERIRKKKNLLTAGIILVWCLLVVFLVGQYMGYWPYLLGDKTYYLEELHNFTPEVSLVENSASQVSVPLKLHADVDNTLYADGTYRIFLSDIGYDDDALSAEKGGLRRWWIELSYHKEVDYTHVSYVKPSETGTAVVTLADGSTHTQELYWQGEHHYENGNAYIRLYFSELPKDTDFSGSTAEISFDPVFLVQWTRTGVGSQAK